MLTIHNPHNGRSTDYSAHYLRTEARQQVRLVADSDDKVRAWGIVVVGDRVTLRVDYLTRDGVAKSLNVAL